MSKHVLRTMLAAGVVFAGAQVASAMDVRVDMKDVDGNSVGTVTVSQAAATVVISADLNNLPAGSHGFHIHENGSCSPDFAAAGGHFNPDGKEHGVNNPNGRHAGDLPNLHISTDGSVKADIYTDAVSLKPEVQGSLVGASGSSLIVHTNADSYDADPGAGGRIACGVISPAAD